MAGIRRKKQGSEHKVFMIPVLDGENECVTICVTVILLLFFLSTFFVLMTEVWPLCIYHRIKEQRERPANAGRSQMTTTASASFIR
jgi:hypothetical protein